MIILDESDHTYRSICSSIPAGILLQIDLYV